MDNAVVLGAVYRTVSCISILDSNANAVTISAVTTSCKMGIRDHYGLMISLIILGSFGRSIGQQNPPGFLSVDCGSSLPRPDPVTNLTWVRDDDYIFTGSKGSIPHVDATLDNYQALSTFRYFPESRSKFCYELPVTFSNISLLLRASFLHGNADELKLPIIFDLYVNATKWTRVTWNSNDDLSQPTVRESIFFIPFGTVKTDVYLVPNTGVPFISSLELRCLDQAGIMYAESFEYYARGQLFFTTLIRQNTGVEADTHSVRYPADMYDRFWSYASSGTSTGQSEKRTSSLGLNLNLNLSLNAVPDVVMDSAWVSLGGDYGRGDSYHQILGNTESGSLTYVVLYFALLNSTEPQIPVNMYLDSQALPPFNITFQPAVQSAFHVLNTNSINLLFSGPFVLNALEVFEQHSFISSLTIPDQVDAINFFKEVYNKTDWQGDPCLPVPYDWLKCNLSYGYSFGSESSDGTIIIQNAWQITSIKLSNLYHSKKLLQYSGVTTFSLSLTTVYMTYSNIGSDVFKHLLNDWLYTGSIKVINFSNNNITALPDPADYVPSSPGPQYPYTVLTTLDMSYNQLSEIDHLTQVFSPLHVEFLDISHNKIKGQFLDISVFTNFSSLRVLNISNNFLLGAIPTSLSLSNLPVLQFLIYTHLLVKFCNWKDNTRKINMNPLSEVKTFALPRFSHTKRDISNNRFSGEFNSGSFFKILGTRGSFKQLNASCNMLTGVLNLTTWFQNLQEVLQDSMKLGDSDRNISSQLYIFTNNNITSIVPKAEQFQFALKALMHGPSFNQSGVLLGGNPYCSGQHHFAQRYLCRSHVYDIVHDDQHKHNKIAIILGSVIGGIVIFLVFSIALLIIWRLQRQNFHYKQIQEEMARRRVHPPYFPYRDLKTATEDFHDSKKLGSGTFGAVYKGELADGTTVAVKRLFRGKKAQVLDEFLNEVVLITGIKHKNLVQLKGCCVENQERILVYEYAENGNLTDAIWNKSKNLPRLGWRGRLNIFIGIARGLSYLHEELQPRIIHRDIKPANVLLDHQLNAKIADFGTARTFVDNEADATFTQKIAGTRGYFAPEYFAEGRVSTKADVYSFGVMALEITSGKRWHKVPQEKGSLRSWAKTLQREGTLVDLLDPALKLDADETEVTRMINIALMCVRIDPELRPTMSEVETMLLEGKERSYNELNSTMEEDYFSASMESYSTISETETRTFVTGTDLSTFSIEPRIEQSQSLTPSVLLTSAAGVPYNSMDSVEMQPQEELDSMPLMKVENGNGHKKYTRPLQTVQFLTKILSPKRESGNI